VVFDVFDSESELGEKVVISIGHFQYRRSYK
jgi:hypothetical protein